MLEVSGLKVRYGEVAAVKGISLSVPKGSIVVLLGANGAGKSSTLNAIAGLVPATGTVSFEGKTISGQPAEDIVKRGIALTPEGRRVFPSLSVADNLHLGGAAHASGEELKRRVEAELDRFPILRERFHQKAGLLSGGEQQMLAIARSLMAGPHLLLLDEPSLGLAPKVFDLILEQVRAIHATGASILIAEQNARKVLRMAHHCYVLENGRVAFEGSGAELMRDPRIEQTYLGAGH
jgi:branched-chain amino acid transport system ATP-binding protein